MRTVIIKVTPQSELRNNIYACGRCFHEVQSLTQLNKSCNHCGSEFILEQYKDAGPIITDSGEILARFNLLT